MFRIPIGFIDHWFPLIRPAIKPLFLMGGTLGGGRLTSHDIHETLVVIDSSNNFECWIEWITAMVISILHREFQFMC